AISGLKSKTAQLSGLEDQYLKKSRELESEFKIRRAANHVEDLAREVAQRERVLSQLGVEHQQRKVELQAEVDRAKDGLDSDGRIAGPRVKQWSKAQPAHADPKSRLTKTVVAGLAGLLLPVLFIVWLDVRRDCINSRDEIERGLGLSVIGAVPMI